MTCATSHRASLKVIEMFLCYFSYSENLVGCNWTFLNTYVYTYMYIDIPARTFCSCYTSSKGMSRLQYIQISAVFICFSSCEECFDFVFPSQLPNLLPLPNRTPAPSGISTQIFHQTHFVECKHL